MQFSFSAKKFSSHHGGKPKLHYFATGKWSACHKCLFALVWFCLNTCTRKLGSTPWSHRPVVAAWTLFLWQIKNVLTIFIVWSGPVWNHRRSRPPISLEPTKHNFGKMRHKHRYTPYRRCTWGIFGDPDGIYGPSLDTILPPKYVWPLRSVQCDHWFREINLGLDETYEFAPVLLKSEFQSRTRELIPKFSLYQIQQIVSLNSIEAFLLVQASIPTDPGSPEKIKHCLIIGTPSGKFERQQLRQSYHKLRFDFRQKQLSPLAGASGFFRSQSLVGGRLRVLSFGRYAENKCDINRLNTFFGVRLFHAAYPIASYGGWHQTYETRWSADLKSKLASTFNISCPIILPYNVWGRRAM